MTVIAITAHRRHTANDIGIARFTMASLMRNPSVKSIVFGGAWGLDTICLEASLEHRETSKVRLIVVVPDLVADQPASCQRSISRADEVVELRQPITEENNFQAYRDRNRRMVEMASVVVAFWNGDPKTGTGHAVGVARELDRHVIVIPVSGGESLQYRPSRA